MPDAASAAVPRDFQWHLQEARAGSRAARDKLWRMAQISLRGTANLHVWGDLHAKDDPLDLVQDTFVLAEKDFAEFHGDCLPALLGWLRALLLGRVRNRRRYYHRAMRHVGHEQSLSEETIKDTLVADTPPPPSEAIRREEVEALHRCLDQLPERWRRVIELRIQEEHPWEEIGARMHCSATAARMVFDRAIQRRRRELTDDCAQTPAGTYVKIKESVGVLAHGTLADDLQDHVRRASRSINPSSASGGLRQAIIRPVCSRDGRAARCRKSSPFSWTLPVAPTKSVRVG